MSRRSKPVITIPAASEDFAAFVADFKARFPDDWEMLRLCPLQHGLETMIEKLKH
jgi:hypothetical protein